MRIIIILLLLCISLNHIQGQVVILNGTVRDGQTRAALPNVNITICPKDSKKIIAFSITKQDGNFQINYTPPTIQNAMIHFSFLGYATQILPIEETKTQYDITLYPHPIDIKEIIVKAPKIKVQGDTIVYNVASFSKEGDKTIGDVLKKLPGIRVEEDGKISYQGTAINKFYI